NPENKTASNARHRGSSPPVFHHSPRLPLDRLPQFSERSDPMSSPIPFDEPPRPSEHAATNPKSVVRRRLQGPMAFPEGQAGPSCRPPRHRQFPLPLTRRPEVPRPPPRGARSQP